MLGIGLAIGLAVGAVLGAVLVRYGLGLGERMAYGAKDGVPVLSPYDTPLEQSHTSGAQDTDLTME